MGKPITFLSREDGAKMPHLRVAGGSKAAPQSGRAPSITSLGLVWTKRDADRNKGSAFFVIPEFPSIAAGPTPL